MNARHRAIYTTLRSLLQVPELFHGRKGMLAITVGTISTALGAPAPSHTVTILMHVGPHTEEGEAWKQ